MMLMKRFQQNAVPFLPHNPATEWDWLFLMQHYGAPTRLLDWSESPLVALYFSVHPQVEPDDEDGALWCMWPQELNSLSGISPDLSTDVPCFAVDPVLDTYLPSTMAREHTTRLLPVAAIARRQFPRMSAQLGTFTITHRDQHALESVASGNHVAKFTIPRSAKPLIREQLYRLRYTELTLFPELTSVARLTNGLVI